MIQSIFDIENRLDIQKEFIKIIEVLHIKPNTCLKKDRYYDTFINMINDDLFLSWKYRDTFLSVSEYLEHIGITSDILSGTCSISPETFLHYIEFLLNMVLCNHIPFRNMDKVVIAILENIHIILEKMNYTFKKVDNDKILIIKRNEDVDSILKKVPESIKTILLEYNDFRNENDIVTKTTLLKKLDLYIEENKKVIKGLDSKLYDTIGLIVNNMGINHPIINAPFNSFTENELLAWYDKCFLLMIHAIRAIDVNNIKNERDKLIIK